MAELTKGTTFNPGDIVDAADLNNLVDAATALKGIVMDQPSAAPVAADDSVLFHDLTTDNLARCKISALQSGVTSVSATAAPATVFSISVATPTTTPAIGLTMDNQVANRVLASPASGTGAPGFRALTVKDTLIATVTIAASVIDWSLGLAFIKSFSGVNLNMTFLNADHGQTIRALFIQDGAHTLAFPATVRWKGGITPVMTTGAGHVDIFTFNYIGGVYYGTADQNFL